MVVKEKANVHSSKMEKDLGDLICFSTQHLRFLKTFQALVFPKKKECHPLISKLVGYKVALSLVISMFIVLTSWSFSFEESNGTSQLR